MGMIGGMFTKQYGGVEGKKLHFYGNAGVCSFKYFVTPDDPQKTFTWLILGINFICFIIITYCYIVINLKSSSSAKNLSTNNNKKL